MTRPTSNRIWYTVEDDIIERALATIVCGVVLATLKPAVTSVIVDAFSDHETEMPDDVRAAQGFLREIGRRQKRFGAEMGITVSSTESQVWDTVEKYASWAGNIDLYASSDLICTIHDSGREVSFAVTEAEMDNITRTISADVNTVLLRDYQLARGLPVRDPIGSSPGLPRRGC